jgi:hypothetical protein
MLLLAEVLLLLCDEHVSILAFKEIINYSRYSSSLSKTFASVSVLFRQLSCSLFCVINFSKYLAIVEVV